MEKKLTNSGPLREPADKHSIYTIKIGAQAQEPEDDQQATQEDTKRPPAESWWVQKLSADLTAD
jgi:hypothetical protein